ncbi:MAG: alanine dehydrogenase [Bacteroidota bacterium]|nr:alanine dehydrogenase [Bacteroidota bacterium]
MGKNQDASRQVFSKYGLTPQEEMLEVYQQKKKFSIGIPLETSMQEARVPLAPLSVASLIESGHKVVIQRSAGKQAHFTDEKYASYGAIMVDKADEVFQSDVMVKIAPFTEKEIDLMHPEQIVFSSIHASSQSKGYFSRIIRKKVVAIAYDMLKDEQNSYPIVRSMSEIAGRSSIMIAAEYLSNVHNGKGEMLGGMTGVKPSEIVILGAGTAGENAARTAQGMGAQVRIFDKSVHRLTRLLNTLNRPVFTSVLQPQVLERVLRSADVLIGAVRMMDIAPMSIVTEDMVKKMKKNSVIVDISIDQGGCVETSRMTNHNEPVYTKHGIVHYCVPNIAARVGRTASYAMSNILAPVLLELGESGSVLNFLKNYKGYRNGVYAYNGILTKKLIGDMFDMNSRDIDLLISAM